ncbi:hypothetical protein PINS_up011342 [Pythium insidiosum]|nr:hypothetical protein PINS_up011342 [Pythium insidiosum]
MAPLRQRWEDLAAACNALKRASSQKDRAAAIRDVQELLADERRRAEIHRWKLWGLLFSSLLHAIKADAQAYLLSTVDSAEKSQQGIAAALAPAYAPSSSSASAKRAKKAVTAPPLHGWSFLRNEFAALHTTDEPALHLDPIGRECLHQLAAFALAVVSRARPSNAIEGDIRTQAWQILELLVRFRVYCGVLEMTLLEDALECALKLLEEEQAERKLKPFERRLKAPELAASALVLQRIVAHSPYDLHHKVERIWSAIAAWLGQQQASDSAGTEISLLDALTELTHRHFDTCQQYVPSHGVDVWRYVQRTWKNNASRIHVHRADFVAAFVEQYDQLLSIKSDRSPHRLRREIGGLLDILLTPEELQRVLHSSKIIRSGSASLIGLNELEPTVVAFLTSSADIMYLHDRLFRAEMATSSVIDSEEPSERKKRSRGSLVTMAWEVLIEHVQDASQSSGSAVAKPSVPTSGPGSHRYLRFGKPRLVVGWMGILLAVLRRHGDFYCQERIGDLLSLMPILVGWLSEKEVDARVALTLQILFQLALLSKRHSVLRSDLFEDHWGAVWTSLLRFDLPYVATSIDHLTNDQIGHLAHSVLGACAALQLVPTKIRLASERSVWRVFCQTSNGITGDVLAQQAACKSIAPLKFLQCLLHQAPQRLDIAPDIRDEPTSHHTMFDELDGGAMATRRNAATMRDHLVGIVFQHIRSNMGHDQVDPSKVSTNSHRREVFGVTYAQALASLVTPDTITIGLSGDDIDLLAQLSRVQRRHRDVVPPDLLGFGVHFVMQEWGLHWLSSSARSDPAFDPDSALPAIREFRASSNHSTSAPNVCSERFVRLELPWQLVQTAPLVNEQTLQVELRQGDKMISVSNDVTEGVMRTISVSFDELLADVVNKLCALNGDVGCCLSLLNDAAMIGVTMSGLYAKLMSTNNRGSLAPSGVSGLVAPLRSFLQLMADHFTAVVIDQARNQGIPAMDSVVNILRQLNSIVLLLQGEQVINDMRHPVADPVDFHFQSELRSSIRRVVAAVEASLELLVMDPDNEATKDFSSNSSLSSLAMSSASAQTISHSLSSQVGSQSGVRMSSLDEDFPDLKWENGEEVPQQLISIARSALSENGAMHSGLDIRDACVRDTWVLEVLFRLNADAFDDFVDAVARNLVDADVYVRMAAARCVQTLFYMYPDGGNQMFQDLLGWVGSLLPFDVAHHGETDTRSKSMANRNRQRKNTERMNSARKLADTTFCLHPSDQSVVSTLMLAMYIGACSSPFVVPEVILTFLCLAKCDDIPVYSDIKVSVIHLWLNEIGATYGYHDVNHLLDNHFGAVWSRYLALMVGGNQAGSSVMADEVLAEFRGHVLLGEEDPNRVSALFRRNVNVIMPTAVLYDAIAAAKSSGDFCFPLVEKIGVRCLSSSVSTTEGQLTGDLRELVEEQLITDLFALAFVLPFSSCQDTLDEVAQKMLAAAEDKAASHGLTVSHLGHVVMKMARFAVLDICRAGDIPSELDVWDRAMKSMKEKYLDFDWSKMNVAELLSEFHELLVCFEFNAPLISRAVECFCQFVHEARGALDSQFVLQQLCLHVCFQALQQICGVERTVHCSSNNKPQNFGRISHRHHVSQAVRRLTFLIRELCDRFMKNTDMFGKYLSVVVRDIADVLVRSQSQDRHSMADTTAATGSPVAISRIQDLWLDSDSRANIEWIMFAICNNLATGLGKYIQELDAVPNGASASLDKLNSLLGSATLTIQQEQPIKSGRPLYGQAKQQIEQFIVRLEREGDRFYRPSPRGLGNPAASQGTMANKYGQQQRHGVSALSSSALAALLPCVLVVRETAVTVNSDEKPGDDVRESAQLLLAQLARALLQLSSRVDANVTIQDTDGDLVSIADILGAIGVWSSNDLELSPGHDAKELNHLYQTNFHRNALHDMKGTFMTQFHESLLSYLSSLLFDRRIQSVTESFSAAYVLRNVLRTIKNVLRITDGTTAIAKSKDTELKQLLELFVHAPASNWSFGIDDANVAVSKLSTTQRNSKFRRQLEEKWASFDVKSFDEWVCMIGFEFGKRIAGSDIASM